MTLQRYLKIGKIGFLVLMIGANIMWISDLARFFYMILNLGYGRDAGIGWFQPQYSGHYTKALVIPIPNVFFTIGVIITCIGIVLVALTFLNYYKTYGIRISIVTFILSLIFPWFLLAGDALKYTGQIYGAVYRYHSGLMTYIWFTARGSLHGTWAILVLVGIILIGIMLILWGVTFYSHRKVTDKAKMTRITSILFIVAGALWCAAPGYFIGSIMLIPAGILTRKSMPTGDAIPDTGV